MKVFFLIIFIVLILVFGFSGLGKIELNEENNYLRYEKINVSISGFGQFDELQNYIVQEAMKYGFSIHVFEYDLSKKTRYYKQENLKDGLIEITKSKTSLGISARWVDGEYGEVFEKVCSFIVEREFDFTVPSVKVEGVKSNQLTKALIMESGCSV